ncbi:hypothetical protein BGZ96_002362 [Linnemannia gamsii]|uniref:Uncharacterized protein n=1 Tax=Linnemannia gamsii TaxID=64522 RepID=A0ABQ7JKQ6_9FUNG|nr:hypothetical protein BGZ96_002362 [Linnemannia gamsii]
MDDEPRTQTLLNQANDQLVDVVALYHTETDQHVVFMDDIFNAFDVASLTIRIGNASVPLARHPSYHFIEPHCIAYNPNATLTVIIGEQRPTSSNPGRPRTPLPVSDTGSTLYEDGAVAAGPLNYAGSVIYSEMSSIKGGASWLGVRPLLEVPTEVDAESEPDMDEINAGIEHVDLEDPDSSAYHLSDDRMFIAFPDSNNSFDNNNNNLNGVGNDRSATPPLSTTSSSESGTTAGSGVSTSSATIIPPSAIETANSVTTPPASGTTAVPEPTEIDPVEATSSWASIFRTLGDLQEQYQLTPEETTKIFTEVTQSA